MKTYQASDSVVNRAAAFLAKTGEDEQPAIQVAGVTVFVYRQDGVMRVSVDLEEADVNAGTPMIDPEGERRVPMHITVQGQTVYEAH